MTLNNQKRGGGKKRRKKKSRDVKRHTASNPTDLIGVSAWGGERKGKTFRSSGVKESDRLGILV